MSQNNRQLLFRNRLYRIFLTVLITGLIQCSSEKNRSVIVARVENLTVTSEDFRDRLNNILLYTTQDNAELHADLLQNLIDEKVLIYEAKKWGYDKTSDYATEKKRIEIDAALDAYRNQVVRPPKISDSHVQREFVLRNEKVRARMLYAPTKEKAVHYYQQLMNGATFGELALDAFQDPGLCRNGGDMGYFSWEDVNPEFSRAAQQLKIGRISKPIRTTKGWYIVKIEDRFLPPYSDNDYHKQYKKMKWLAIHRESVKAIRQYTRKRLKELNISFNEPILLALMKNTPKESSSDEGSFSDYGLKGDDVIATVAGKPWTLNTLYKKAQWTSVRQRNSVKDVDGLRRFIEGLAVRDVLLKEAVAKGVWKQKRVQTKIQKRLELYLINKMNHDITDTVRVSEKEARDYFNRFRKQFVFPARVDVREILADSEKTARALLKRIRAGEDFAKLARHYSLRKWAAKRGGELGYGTESEYGVYGKMIFKMKPAEIAGPLKTGAYYSIVQIIDRRPSQLQTFEQARPEIETLLLKQKKYNVLHERIGEMRKKLDVACDLNGLK